MNAFEKIIDVLCFKLDEAPESFGLFHLISALILIAATAFILVKFKDCSDKTFRILLSVFWGIFILGEIYREIALAFDVEDGVASWSYAWHQFPFHLCATAMYVLPFIILLKDSPVRQACIAYVATFSFFGGLAVMVYPSDVYISTLGVSIQSMVHHGMQVLLGALCFAHQRHRFNLRYYVKSIPVFAIVVSIALLLNETVYAIFTANGITDSFNMFYISRHFDCTLPLLDGVYLSVPYPVFLCIYILGFVIISFIMFLLHRLALLIATQISARFKNKEITE